MNGGHSASRTAAVLAALLVSAVLGGCDRSGNEKAPAADRPAAADAAAAAPPPGTTPVTTERIAAGEPWTEAEKYIRKLRFAPEFPMSDLQKVKICNACAETELLVMADSNVRHLTIAEMPGKMRVLAKVVLVHSGTLIPKLGFTAQNTDGESFLLQMSDGTVRFMYNASGKIALTTPWRLALPSGHHATEFPMARWLRLKHTFVPKVAGLLIDEHLSGIWLACSEGCCVAQAQ